MNFGVSGVESAGGWLRRVALRRETVARWTVYERDGEWCGECLVRAAEGCIDGGIGGAMDSVQTRRFVVWSVPGGGRGELNRGGNSGAKVTV